MTCLEVFNYFNGKLQLQRNKKKLNGYNFQTNSDTEVLLATINSLWLDCLEMLNGFSLCIYDTKNNEMYIARDRLGIKPLLLSKK